MVNLIAMMFSAVNSPTPRVLCGMVGFVSLVLAGTLRAALLSLSRPMGPWCAKLSSNVLWRAVRPV